VAFGFIRSLGEKEARFLPAAAASSAPDTTAPQQPVNLVVSGRSTDTVALVWDAGIDNVGVTGYRVQRDGTQVGTTSTPDYTDRGLVANTTHTYTVTAIDAAGNVSVASAAVTATTLKVPDTTKPSAPGNLRVTGRSTTSIVLGWTAATDDIGVARYEVRRDGNTIATVAALRFTDSGLAPATSHSYVVVAIDASGNISSPAGPVTGVTLTAPDTTPPSAPGSLHLTGATSTTISLAWNASSDDTGVTNYLVYRNGILVASPTAVTYNDPGLTPATTYTYQVKAIDGAGNVSAAAVVSAATIAPKVSGINTEVSIGAVPACTVTVTASVSVTTGPVNVDLQVVINGVTTTASVSFSGTGPASQTVNVGTGSGTQDGSVQVSSTSPNAMTSSKTWTAPDACRPGFTVGSPAAQADGCGSPTISGSVRVATRNNPGPVQYTVQMLVDGGAVAETTITLSPNSSDVVGLTSPDPFPNGTYTVSYVVTPQGGSGVSSSDVPVEVNC
jgi:chitodextrinase